MNKFLEFWNYNRVWNHVLFKKTLKLDKYLEATNQKIKTFEEIAKSQAINYKTDDKRKISWSERKERTKKFFLTYISSLLLFKNVFLKFITILFFAGLIFGLGFGLRYHYVYVVRSFVLNPGVGMSILAGQAHWIVYTVQSLPCIFAFLAFLFVPQWWICFGFTMMFFGGLMNLIDRSMGGWVWDDNQIGTGGRMIKVNLKNCVVDYFNAATSVFNISDVFVLIGVGFVVASIILLIIFLFLKEQYNGVYPWEHGFNKAKITSKFPENANHLFTIDKNK